MVDDTPPEIKEHRKREEYKDGLFYEVEHLAQLYGEHHTTLAEARKTMPLADAKGFRERTLKAYDADVLAKAEGAPTDEARQRFTDGAMDLRDRLKTLADHDPALIEAKQQERPLGAGRKRRQDLAKTREKASQEGRPVLAEAIQEDLNKLKEEKPLAFGVWSNVPDPGHGVILVDPVAGRVIPGPDGMSIRPSKENMREMRDLPQVPRGHPDYNTKGKMQGVQILYPNGDTILAHDKNGQQPPKYLSEKPVTFTPKEAKELGLGEFTPPEGGWDTGIKMKDGIKALEYAWDAYKLIKKGRVPGGK